MTVLNKTKDKTGEKPEDSRPEVLPPTVLELYQKWHQLSQMINRLPPPLRPIAFDRFEGAVNAHKVFLKSGAKKDLAEVVSYLTPDPDSPPALRHFLELCLKALAESLTPVDNTPQPSRQQLMAQVLRNG